MSAGKDSPVQNPAACKKPAAACEKPAAACKKAPVAAAEYDDGKGGVRCENGRGEWNPADALTKGLGQEKMRKFLEICSQVFADGRAERSLKLKNKEEGTGREDW